MQTEPRTMIVTGAAKRIDSGVSTAHAIASTAPGTFGSIDGVTNSAGINLFETVYGVHCTGLQETGRNEPSGPDRYHAACRRANVERKHLWKRHLCDERDDVDAGARNGKWQAFRLSAPKAERNVANAGRRALDPGAGEIAGLLQRLGGDAPPALVGRAG